jgi:hypothetical protein
VPDVSFVGAGTWPVVGSTVVICVSTGGVVSPDVSAKAAVGATTRTLTRRARTDAAMKRALMVTALSGLKGIYVGLKK